MTSRDPLTGYGKLAGGARKPRTVKPDAPVTHSTECEAAWSNYQTTLRKYGWTVSGFEPTDDGPVAAARAVYVKAAKSCLR